MSGFDWQLVVALVCVAAAAVVLMRRAWGLVVKRSEGCGSGGCGGCPANGSPSGAPQATPFVGIETLAEGRLRK